MSVLIIGAGEVGFMIAKRLTEENIDVYIVEKDEAKVNNLSQMLDAQIIWGSGSSIRTLKKANVEHAEMLIAVTDSDEVNLVAAFIAGSFANIPAKIVRIRNKEYESSRKIFEEDYLDIDLIINPEQEAASIIMNILDIPGCQDAVRVADGRIRLGGFKIGASSPLVYRSLQEISTSSDTNGMNFLIAAILRQMNLLIPKGSDKILPGDRVYVVLDQGDNKEILSFMGTYRKPMQNLIIYGGSITGETLASNLEHRNVNVKLIEHDEKRCIELSERLSSTTVLNIPSVNRDLLEAERISDQDAFIAVSNDEEANILSSLLAKRIGCPHVIALVNNTDYVSLVSDIGVDAVVNPRMAAVAKILQFIRKGKIFSMTSLSDIEAEVLEVEAMETSDLVERPIKKIKWPKDAIIAGVIRGGEGKVIAPKGDTVIDPGDRVIIFAKRGTMPKVEKVLSVKLNYF
ncbi:MAG TPA: Trk system potassium transporter TrkA [Deltaproteobacteria bacterium]|jgi:trk system potassium uptake protein TrkA|nr:Trk system potassium transporter TrkA [Deltaproteobacteria bacterium]MDI9543387.1 Trk system potassium transporter TrkA [Pseudomonadota bacterium]NLW68418.1 Trk system potassium transporter TrkA [Bacteriovoracaceae bacterium]HRR21253.1 Trk system potassium transporter TrkA [Desulfomonilia bacterium]HNR51090.1 Trk system potassium transporter TrkA [Deltaproteobacteria bacterium]